MIGNDFERIKYAAGILEKNGVDSARFEAKQLCAYFCDDASLQAALDRRIKGEPLQYILGEWEFYGITLKTDKRALIPRADTETLVDVALNFLKDKPHPNVIDLCSGTGCIAIAISNFLGISVDALEKYSEPFSVLEENIALNHANVNAIKGDVTAPFKCDKKYDLIVSNPPYIKTADMRLLQREVLFEPHTALDGGADGCDFYKSIAKNFIPALKTGGMLAVEIGIHEEAAVKHIFEENGLCNIIFHKDIPGIIRVVSGIKP